MPCGVEQFYHHCIVSTAKMVKSFEMAKGKGMCFLHGMCFFICNNNFVIAFIA